MNDRDVKATQHSTWTAAAQGWRKHDDVIAKGAAVVSERMLDCVGLEAGHHVLDIASGTGEPALTAAERVGPSGSVLGTDLADAMLEVARDKAKARALSNIEFRCVDGEALNVEPGTVDAVTCRWGLMFMPDPAATLTRAHRALKPGGRMAAATWAEPERNPFASLPMKVLMQHVDVPTPPPGSPGIFGLADRGRLESLFQEAGFSDVVVEEREVTILEAESGAAYWAIMRELAGPIRALINTLPAEKQVVVEREIGEAAETLRRGDVVRATGVTWIAHGRKV